MNNKTIRQAAISSVKPLYKMLPILVGVILLISLASALIPKNAFTKIFTMNIFIDPFIGAALGSVLAGNPITSYILGGEFLSLGVSLIAIIAFLVAWVSVGLVQLPAELVMLGKKFTIARNILCFIFSILVAICTVAILGAIPW